MTAISTAETRWAATRKANRLRSIHYQLDLMSNLVARDMKLRYKGSVLGLLWSLLQPAALIAVYSFLFTRVITLDIPNYVPFLVAGVLPWNWFATSLDFASDSLLANRELIKKAVFPSEMLMVAAVTSNLLILALGTLVLLAFLVVSGIALTPAALFLPIIVAIQYSFTLGLALIVSMLNVYFRDIRHLLGVALFAWFFLTPVFYDEAQVPAAYHGLYVLNPMAHIINFYRDVLLFGRIPNGLLLLQLIFVSAIVLGFGLTVFRQHKSGFAEEL
ncbi:MAG: ABC transporter permease [Chloroflexi bacterium]|nr:ABC transporter permease [Chloroflexota bacterium]